MTRPSTVWEDQDGVSSGGGGIVRAASFPIGDGERGGVTLTLQVPNDFYAPIEGGVVPAQPCS